MSKSKSILRWLVPTGLAFLTLIDIETFVLIGLPMLVVFSSIIFQNKFYSISGQSRVKMIKRELMNYIPMLFISTICYLITSELNSTNTDLVFFTEDRGFILNIVLRGGLYISILTFVTLLFSPFSKLIVLCSNLEFKKLAIFYPYFLITLFSSIQFGLALEANTNGFTIVQNILLIIVFAAGSVLTYLLLALFNKKIKFV